VINHLSHGVSPSDIMQGAIHSLVDRSIQLMRRVQLAPEYTLVGGILRFGSMGTLLRGKLGQAVNVPAPEIVQMIGAVGAAVLGQRRVVQIASRQPSATSVAELTAGSPAQGDRHTAAAESVPQ
jgi:activator of 2-hydroxyglutaryl-CoA dehydratase